ncbi:hypothetical protein [Clostridioides difficile]|uniref:hypothetical protein n=1 Tax=Clostridioides difficile TaxID=1496 RepID=UPI0013044681|nr:hypothetical protein [Clostridioides difficile]
MQRSILYRSTAHGDFIMTRGGSRRKKRRSEAESDVYKRKEMQRIIRRVGSK